MKCEPADGRVNGREYHGLVYFVTDDDGKVIANPFKASRLGKFAGREAIEGRFGRAKERIDPAPTKRTVADVLAGTTVKDDFVAKLKERHIDVVFRYTDEGRIYGATFIDHNTMSVLNGSRLGKEFSANALNERFNNPQVQPEATLPVTVNPTSPEDSEAANTQEPSQNHQAESQSQTSATPSRDSLGDNDFSLPGLDLFQPGMAVNPDEEEFRRRMQRKKKKGHRPKF